MIACPLGHCSSYCCFSCKHCMCSWKKSKWTWCIPCLVFSQALKVVEMTKSGRSVSHMQRGNSRLLHRKRLHGSNFLRIKNLCKCVFHRMQMLHQWYWEHEVLQALRATSSKASVTSLSWFHLCLHGLIRFVCAWDDLNTRSAQAKKRNCILIRNSHCIWMFGQASADFFRKSNQCFPGHLDACPDRPFWSLRGKPTNQVKKKINLSTECAQGHQTVPCPNPVCAYQPSAVPYTVVCSTQYHSILHITATYYKVLLCTTRYYPVLPVLQRSTTNYKVLLCTTMCYFIDSYYRMILLRATKQ